MRVGPPAGLTTDKMMMIRVPVARPPGSSPAASCSRTTRRGRSASRPSVSSTSSAWSRAATRSSTSATASRPLTHAIAPWF